MGQQCSSHTTDIHMPFATIWIFSIHIEYFCFLFLLLFPLSHTIYWTCMYAVNMSISVNFNVREKYGAQNWLENWKLYYTCVLYSFLLFFFSFYAVYQYFHRTRTDRSQIICTHTTHTHTCTQMSTLLSHPPSTDEIFGFFLSSRSVLCAMNSQRQITTRETEVSGDDERIWKNIESHLYTRIRKENSRTQKKKKQN